MADVRSISCGNESCDNVFETTNSRKRYCSDACRLEQWERERGVAHKWVPVKPKRKAPAKPRVHWKAEYEKAVEAIGVLIDELRYTQSQVQREES